MTTIAVILGIAVIVLLCIAGVLISCLTLSGTWLIVGAAAVAALLPVEAFPGWWTVAAFAVVSVIVEIVEFLAGYWGVRRQAGSKLAGFVALVGGMAGLLVGSFIPPPVVGSLIGMLVLSFVPVYIVERHRLKASGPAARIAAGAVVARVAVILVKVAAALGMTATLCLQMVA